VNREGVVWRPVVNREGVVLRPVVERGDANHDEGFKSVNIRSAESAKQAASQRVH
jgi:hypothetical protein